MINGYIDSRTKATPFMFVMIPTRTADFHMKTHPASTTLSLTFSNTPLPDEKLRFSSKDKAVEVTEVVWFRFFNQDVSHVHARKWTWLRYRL
jgi:hypothetical protein